MTLDHFLLPRLLDNDYHLQIIIAHFCFLDLPASLDVSTADTLSSSNFWFLRIAIKLLDWNIAEITYG